MIKRIIIEMDDEKEPETNHTPYPWQRRDNDKIYPYPYQENDLVNRQHIPPACRGCPNFGKGPCWCILGSPTVTC